MCPATSLEKYFGQFRDQIIGQQQVFEMTDGPKRILYADWAASGRAYRPIESWILEEILPFYANTHTGSTLTGSKTSAAYGEARAILKAHVHANEDDVLLFCGSGMTSAVNKLQRILGWRLPERILEFTGDLVIEEEARPLVLITHMEHHSNHISWLETIATVEMINPAIDGNVDLDHLRQLLEQYRHRKYKIAAVTACSNVTGIEVACHAIAEIMHSYGGMIMVDFTCSAPYVNIDMHPVAANAYLDAIYFSCHKFLGGPGTPGVLIFNKRLYTNQVPDQPGGGTLLYTNPWKEREYIDNIEEREDGGTPGILQAIKAGLCVRLKEEMGVENILEREKELVRHLLNGLLGIPEVKILAAASRKRLGVVSFVVADIHYDRMVQLLNDNFGIQARSGCSCAGTYGHLLLGISKLRSAAVLKSLRAGDCRSKPGWIRLSLHPTMTDAEIDFIVNAVEQTVRIERSPVHIDKCPSGSNF